MFFPALLKGLTLGLLLSISVGPVIFAIIKQSISNGHKGGLAFVFGVSASDIAFVLVCNVFTQLFTSAMAHEKIIGVCGSAFLMILGIFNFFFKKTTTAQDVAIVEKKVSKRDLASASLSGFFRNTLNPGAFIVWFAASATILQDSKSYVHFYQYRIVVFATCLIFVLSSDIAKVFLAGKI